MDTLSASSVLWAHLAENIRWPCAVRFSARVKRAKIRVDGQGHVEVILPQKSRYTAHDAQNFLDSLLPWLQKTLDAMVPRVHQAQKAAQCLQKITGSLEADVLPTSVYFPLLAEQRDVHLQTKRGGYAKLQEQGHDGLILYAHEHEVRSCCKLLQKWLLKKSTHPLQEKTLALAQDLGLEVAKISMGAQKGRWGSCSSAGNIRLNCRLLLLPEYLIDHVILHELCHRVHMNHSPAFKALLEKVSPQSKRKDKDLALAWKNLPFWALVE